MNTLTPAAMTNPDGSLQSGWATALAVALAVAALLVFAFVVCALVSVLRSGNLSVAGKALWVVLMLVFPILGSLVWFLWGRHARLDALAPTGVATRFDRNAH